MSYEPAPLSKTAKYKKITKPLLERKRRARINRCLDELKDLMVGALEIDDDNLSKLEKADILELTVNHLTKLHSPRDPVVEAKKFQAGFGQCAAEACRFIMSVPDLDEKVSQSLVSHLSRLITAQPLTIQVPDRPHFSPPTSPSSVVSDRYHHYSDHERSSSDAEDSVYSTERLPKQWARQNIKEYKQIPPLSGLLTTVDKLAPQRYVPDSNSLTNAHRDATYVNRVTVEAKDVILQKIRQHIMEKRGNEGSAGDANVTADPEPTACPQRDDGGDVPRPYSNSVSNDTLDLRKIRSPKCASPEKPVALRTSNQLGTIPSSDNVGVTVNLPERCELPMDYSNLPPKKKRKLIEYQEYKKQEEARRQLEAFYAAKKEHVDRPPAENEEEGSKWRPW